MIDARIFEVAHEMADAAGNVLRRHFRSGLASDAKEDGSPVTQADREAESAMRALIEKHFPTYGILGEEYGSVREEAPWQWVLDPIDGTHAFMAGEPTFTTLIALCHHGLPVLGLIDQPVVRERWLGIAGTDKKSATLGGKPVSVKPAASLAQARLATTGMKYFTAPEEAAFESLQAQCAETAFGGDAYLYAGLARGDFDLVAEAGLKPYDFCALAPVVEGAGGVITDWAGRPLTLRSGGQVLAAATSDLHAQALALLKPVAV